MFHVKQLGSVGARLLAVAFLAALALFAAACGAPPGPVGWAGALPIKVDGQDMILVSHKSHLYALKKGSSVGEWQFPPKDKNAYPVSTESAQKINDQIDQFSLDASAKSDLKRKVADLTVAGPTAGVLKDAIDASGATEAEKSSIKKSIDSALTFEKDALNKLKALYGDTGISADGRTAYVPTFRGMLFALDTTTGHVRWVRDAGAEMVGGVAVDGDTIYVGTKADRLFAINGKTGERLWEFTTRGEVWATPTVDGDTIYATSLDGALYALDESGKQKWVFTMRDPGSPRVRSSSAMPSTSAPSTTSSTR